MNLIKYLIGISIGISVVLLYFVYSDYQSFKSKTEESNGELKLLVEKMCTSRDLRLALDQSTHPEAGNPCVGYSFPTPQGFRSFTPDWPITPIK